MIFRRNGNTNKHINRWVVKTGYSEKLLFLLLPIITSFCAILKVCDIGYRGLDRVALKIMGIVCKDLRGGGGWILKHFLFSLMLQNSLMR